MTQRGPAFKLPAKLIFMRHGEAEHNVNDTVDSRVTSKIHLTDTGRQQVMDSARLLRSEGIDKILCSPLLRTRQTAILVAESLEIPLDEIQEEHELRELDCGDWDGKSYAEFMTLFVSHIDIYYTNPHYGESEEHCLLRTKGYLETLFSDEHYAGKTLLLVTHGAIVRVAHMIFADQSPEETYGETACPICPTGQFRRYELSWEGEAETPLWKGIQAKEF